MWRCKETLTIADTIGIEMQWNAGGWSEITKESHYDHGMVEVWTSARLNGQLVALSGAAGVRRRKVPGAGREDVAVSVDPAG